MYCRVTRWEVGTSHIERSTISVNLRLKGPSPGRPGDGAQSLNTNERSTSSVQCATYES